MPGAITGLEAIASFALRKYSSKNVHTYYLPMSYRHGVRTEREVLEKMAALRASDATTPCCYHPCHHPCCASRDVTCDAESRL